MFVRFGFMQTIATMFKIPPSGNNSHMNFNRKKLIVSIVCVFMLAIAAVATLCACDGNEVSQQSLAQSCIRIHIRANSDSAADQAVKLKVRDSVTQYLQDALVGCKSKEEAARVLERERSSLVKLANNALRANGFDYTSSIRIDNEYFPDRVYDGYDFPAGNYDAVVINLGSGNGANWWCVAFPPLCFVPDSQNGEKIVYKSWIKEIMEKIFG